MAEVIFYAKPGCQGNARQIRVLQASGHQVIVRDLLSEPWSPAGLQGFFGARPVAEWFNRSAVRVKRGEVVPECLAAEDAMALLVADPALIRRPLLEVAGERRAGWDPVAVAAWIGLDRSLAPGGEGCARADPGDAAKTCRAEP
ncbi:MAG: hypothetical protein GC191_04795 [Azospirillum sp.]|nr:hypothetical protein [Azospirillum sp.]